MYQFVFYAARHSLYRLGKTLMKTCSPDLSFHRPLPGLRKIFTFACLHLLSVKGPAPRFFCYMESSLYVVSSATRNCRCFRYREIVATRYFFRYAELSLRSKLQAPSSKLIAIKLPFPDYYFIH